MSFRGTLIQLPTRWTVFFPADFNTFFATTTTWRIAVTVNVLKSAGKKIGGEVEQELTKWIAAGNDLNGCALRLSIALNNAGYTIPAMGKQTLKGANGMNYIVNAELMYNYLRKVYPGHIVSYTHHKKVNYGLPFIPKRYFSNASGHVDVVFNYKWGSTGGYGYYDQQKKRDFQVSVIQ